MYEKASVKGVGYKNVEMIVSTQTGFNGQKLVEKESGSGNVITERTELEAERQLRTIKGLRNSGDVLAGDQLERSVGEWVPIGFPVCRVRMANRTTVPHGLHQLHQGS